MLVIDSIYCKENRLWKLEKSPWKLEKNVRLRIFKISCIYCLQEKGIGEKEAVDTL